MAQVWVRTRFIHACVIWCVCLIDLFDISIYFSFLPIFSLITVFFSLPVNFIFQDVVDKFPVHPGRERASHMTWNSVLGRVDELFVPGMRFYTKWLLSAVASA